MRYSFEPVDALRGDTEISVLADKVGVAHGTVQRWRERGMEEHNADAVAIALGLHPWQLWPEMLAAATVEVSRECESPTCFESFVPRRSTARFCSRACYEASPGRKAARAASARERYARNVDAERERTNRYKASARSAVNAKRRAYYQRNREVEIAKNTARKRARREAA